MTAADIDPLGQPTVTVGSDHCFRTCNPSVRPTFHKTNFKPTCETVGVAEWIIDDWFKCNKELINFNML